MNKINDKIFAWLPEEAIEPEAMIQIKNIAAMPFVFDHVAVMPDCHLGRGATVGSVIATKDAIIPAAVGVDIGCGMIAVKTKFSQRDLKDDLGKLRHSIERSIPVSMGGMNHALTPTALMRVQQLITDSKHDHSRYTSVDKGWQMQMGSLGSGNHFIEISVDEEQNVWIVLHSGSRGIGNKLAGKHIKIAQKLMEEMMINLADPDLAYLPIKFPGFQDYIDDLLWAQEFARLNREEMMDRVLKDFSHFMFNELGHEKEIELERINCHHNFTQQEHHMGQNVWITRKGAIQMRQGQLGVIPGSMGTRSYIVSGKENALAYHSAPHGAGRRFSRNEARKRFTMEDFDRDMAGIECRRTDKLIDELPGAYKDIDDVMENSKELVDVKHVLKQILNVKGD